MKHIVEFERFHTLMMNSTLFDLMSDQLKATDSENQPSAWLLLLLLLRSRVENGNCKLECEVIK